LKQYDNLYSFKIVTSFIKESNIKLGAHRRKYNFVYIAERALIVPGALVR